MIINGKSRILKWRYVSTIFLAIFCGDIPWNLGLKNRPYIWDWYLQSIGSWVMAIDMWIELDLPSGYLLHSHGESPFLSSVNHLFLWTIEKPWQTVSHNQRVSTQLKPKKHIPSGKLSHNELERSTMLWKWEKSLFQNGPWLPVRFLYVYQRVYHHISH